MEEGKNLAKTRFQICEGGCRLKFLSGELGPPASSWQVVNASDGTGRKQWNRQAGRAGRAGVRWCGRTLVGCGTGRTGGEFGSLRRGRAEALAEPGSQAAAAAAGGGGAAGQVRRHSRSCRTAAGTVGNGPATAKSQGCLLRTVSPVFLPPNYKGPGHVRAAAGSPAPQQATRPHRTSHSSAASSWTQPRQVEP